MMAVSQIKAPPVFNEEEDYLNWKNDLEVWKLFTDTEKKKMGPAVYLTLTGRAREAVRDLKPADIGKETGLDEIIVKLDAVYLKDENTCAYVAFKEFYEFKRASGENFSEFIVKYEHLYHKLTQYKMDLPKGVQAFLLLNAANMTEENEKLARTTARKLTYSNMKETIMRIFGDPGAVGDEVKAPAIKEEVFYAGYRRGSNRRGGRGRGSRYLESMSSSNQRNENREPNTLNPRDRSGNILKCFNCYSIKHNKCPHPKDVSNIRCHKCGLLGHLAFNCSEQKEDKVEESSPPPHVEYITLLNSKPDRMKNLIGESFGMAVLDSGCTKSVTGEMWLDEYLQTLLEQDRLQVSERSNDATFRFGDGVEVTSSKLVKFPVVIGSQKFFIEADVVKNELPLLLSRQSMKRAEMIINFSNDTVNVGGKDIIKLTGMTSGHYCLLLFHDSSSNCKIVLHAVNFKTMTVDEKKKKAAKLHRQFSHASKEKLIQLVKNSNYNDKDFQKCIEDCCNNCEICHKYKSQPLRPVVGLPLGTDFNQVVCMDLKEVEHNKTWFLHLIDSVIRYSQACLVHTKHQDEIIRQIYLIWISYFGCPRKFLSDNGGEFANKSFIDMCAKLNIEVATTAGESPFSNGTVERHNKILAEGMQKTLDDVKCALDMALAWAVSAKNALQNCGGYSPNQLVFGRNVNMPTVLEDKLPALESNTSSDIIRKNLEALHSARKNFIQAESSERIRRALRHNVHTYADESFNNGDRVYYKQKKRSGWSGPATVLGQDDQFVLVRRGSSCFRVHPCQLIKTCKWELSVI